MSNLASVIEGSDLVLVWCSSSVFACLAVIKIFEYKKLLDEKNVQLIQFYLDGKFLYKNLVESISVASNSEFCIRLINNIKEYYNLEDVVIIDSIKMIDGENNTALRSEVIKCIQKNIVKINSATDWHRLGRFTCKSKIGDYVMYIASIASKDEGDGLIICVEQAPALLTKQEKISLENSINLLKTRLLHG